jgi:cell division protein ZapA (FtsZ GTPase activity inhibitor)
VRLFGREYRIKGHGNRKYVEELADFINGTADEIQRNTNVVSTLDLVVLTLLNITDELFRSRQAKDATLEELEEKTKRLIKAIDRGV